MKNTIPLIMAVILGLAAVFAVSRTVARSSSGRERRIEVVVAGTDLEENAELSKVNLSKKSIPYSGYINHQQVPYEDVALLEGRKLKRAVASNGFIFYDDVEGSESGFSHEVVTGEWVVPVHFADATLAGMMEEGDEVAIVTIHDETLLQESEGGKAQINRVPEQRTIVLFPQLRILRKEGDDIFVSLPPKKAMMLLTANRNMPLFPMLRRRGDTTNLSVADGGIVTLGDLSYEALMNMEKSLDKGEK
jgi:hypothetical protein